MSSLDHYLDQEDLKQRNFDPIVLKGLVKLLTSHQRHLFKALFFVLLGTAALLLEAQLMKHLVDRGLLAGNPKWVKGIAFAYFGTLSLRAVSVFFQNRYFDRISQAILQTLRLRIFNKYQSLTLKLLDQTPVGRLITRLSNDTAAMSDMFSMGFFSILANLLFILGSLIALAWIDFKLFAVSLCLFPLMVYFCKVLTLRLIQSFRLERTKMSSLNAFLAENLAGIKVIQLFGQVTNHLTKMDHVAKEYVEARVSSIRSYATLHPMITVVNGVSLAIALLYGSHLVDANHLTLGALVAYVWYLQGLFNPIRDIVDKWNVFLSGFASAERVFTLMDWEEEYPKEEGLVSQPRLALKGEIEFEKVWFAYGEDKWVLKDLSFKVPAGSSLGLVGHTGAGKTTITALLMRFYDPTRGRILIDGKDISQYSRRELRSAMGWIQQEPFVFSGALRENLSLFDPQIKTSEFSHLDKELEERGVNLSLGERQLLSFYRTKAHDPSIWILDEASASLDTETEKTLQSELQKSSDSKTLLVIAHRLSTVQDLDQILVLHEGKLVEKGTHEELLRMNGVYKKLSESC